MESDEKSQRILYNYEAVEICDNEPVLLWQMAIFESQYPFPQTHSHLQLQIQDTQHLLLASMGMALINPLHTHKHN